MRGELRRGEIAAEIAEITAEIAEIAAETTADARRGVLPRGRLERGDLSLPFGLDVIVPPRAPLGGFDYGHPVIQGCAGGGVG